ncbi:interleukin-7 receptor subunit alpha isoform X2 [Narcine bancroftii]|uniref:interleukin-7 receptor subunit alpha isoform X2 n=1 Tax=Narcine bancroftii TaxID=1343680 RepID=UPI00383157B2
MEVLPLMPALLLLLYFSRLQAESGSDDADDDPDLPWFSCFVRFMERSEMEWMSCEVSEPLIGDDNITFIFSEQDVWERCSILALERSCRVPVARFTLIRPCCIRVLRPKTIQVSHCALKQKITHMVKTSAPYNMTVTSLLEAEEMEVKWAVSKIRFTELLNHLLHQVSYWSTESSPQLNSTVCSLRLLMKNLVANVQYTIQVRSKPNNDYFKGMWSDWSEPVTFTVPSMLSTGVTMTYSLVVLLLLLLFLVGLLVLFWENRIKSRIWPKIPNPKKTLGQLYMNPKKAIEVSFDPDHFLDVTEGVVDVMSVKAGWQWPGYPLLPPPTLLVGESGEPLDLGQDWSGTEEHGDPWPECTLPSVPLLSPGAPAQDTPAGAVACAPENKEAAEAGQGKGGQCPFTHIPAPPSDESYITMSNLYKAQ